jgi:hypothetical protein
MTRIVTTHLRAALIAVLIGALMALVPLAYADPPDDTWAGGVWDDDDFDLVVLTVASTVALVDASPIDQVEPTLPIVGTVVARTASAVSSDARSSHQPRSPPL